MDQTVIDVYVLYLMEFSHPGRIQDFRDILRKAFNSVQDVGELTITKELAETRPVEIALVNSVSSDYVVSDELVEFIGEYLIEEP